MVHEDDAGVVASVPDSAAHRLVDALHAQVLVICLAGRAGTWPPQAQDGRGLPWSVQNTPVWFRAQSGVSSELPNLFSSQPSRTVSFLGMTKQEEGARNMALAKKMLGLVVAIGDIREGTLI